jgi:hypothetical protein
MARQFGLRFRLPRKRRVLLHAANLRHGTDGFTSTPNEGMLRIFSLEKSDGFGRVRTHDLGYYPHFFFALFLLVSCTLLVWNCSGIRRKTACCGFFHYEKSDGFGRERTRDLGYQRPACKPLDHRSRCTPERSRFSYYDRSPNLDHPIVQQEG